MKKLKIILLLAISAFELIALHGCASSMDPSRSQLPWAKPAAWEMSSPGMAF